MLEESITKAQNRESHILFMTQWMVEVSDLIQSRLDADLLAGDVPNEYEVSRLTVNAFLVYLTSDERIVITPDLWCNVMWSINNLF